MSKPRQIKSIIKHAHNIEKDAARTLADSQQHLSDCEAKLAEMRLAREEYLRDFQSPGQRMTAAQMSDLRRFTAKLDQAIGLLERQLHQQQQMLERHRGQWHQSRNKVNVLEDILERQTLEDNRHREHRQQLEMEDRPLRKPFEEN